MMKGHQSDRKGKGGQEDRLIEEGGKKNVRGPSAILTILAV
jgi:hypothetical protein